MSELTNEFLFYGGIIFVIGSAIVYSINFFMTKIKELHLSEKLNIEYGSADK